MLGNKYAVRAECYLAHNISLRVCEVLQRNLSIRGIEAQVFDGSREHGCPGFHTPKHSGTSTAQMSRGCGPKASPRVVLLGHVRCSSDAPLRSY